MNIISQAITDFYEQLFIVSLLAEAQNVSESEITLADIEEFCSKTGWECNPS